MQVHDACIQYLHGVAPRTLVGSKAHQASSGSYHIYQSQPQTKSAT